MTECKVTTSQPLPKTTLLKLSERGLRACPECHYTFYHRGRRVKVCPRCGEQLLEVEEYDPTLPEDIAGLFELDLTFDQRFHLLSAIGVYLSGSRGWADALIRWVTTGEELEYYLPEGRA